MSSYAPTFYDYELLYTPTFNNPGTVAVYDSITIGADQLLDYIGVHVGAHIMLTFSSTMLHPTVFALCRKYEWGRLNY